ncbi:MAG: 4-(cytidine 5'-diphospho)-2-C-methyl-D-erythritol kinase [Candidatus Omnitrophota bacterium]
MTASGPLKVRSYAKLNLFLKVTGRRPDGFHELVTLFERIDLYDNLTFVPAPPGKIIITCDDRRVPCDARNLVYRVAVRLMEGEKVWRGARIHIAKRIPVAAGLAGGSSNAAAAITGLDRLWGLKLSLVKRLAYARAIGSDVAFFLYDTPFALGTGRGDIIKPLAVKAQLWHVLVVPRAPVLTKDVYGLFGKTAARLTKPDANVSMIVRSLKQQDPGGVGRALVNDLEAPILALKPQLAQLKARLIRQMPLGVSFSGSGPTVFAVTASPEEALRIKNVFSRSYRQVFAARTF